MVLVVGTTFSEGFGDSDRPSIGWTLAPCWTSGLVDQDVSVGERRAGGTNDGLPLDVEAAPDTPLMCRGQGRGKERLVGMMWQRKCGSLTPTRAFGVDF